LMFLQLLLMPQYLAIHFINQRIDCGIQILRKTLDVKHLALEAQIHFGALAARFVGQLLYAQRDRYINHVIKMAGDAFQLVVHILSYGSSQFEVITSDCQVHTTLLWVLLPVMPGKTSLAYQNSVIRENPKV